MKLSYKQRADLKALLDPGSYVRRRGCTNATLSALERRGLVTLASEPSEYDATHRVLRWSITDAGKVAVTSGDGKSKNA